MSFKTILVQLNNPGRAAAVLEVAVALAARTNAHLVGLHVFPAHKLAPPVPLPFAGDLAARIRAKVQEETDRIRAIFTEMTERQPFVAEWRYVTTDLQDIATVVMDHGRAADLIIASQSDPAFDLSAMLDFPERLAIESGRPVLVVPAAGRFAAVPERVLIAWNNKREAARAVFDALPFLQNAKSVSLLTVSDGKLRANTLPDTEIAAALARHGVALTAERVSAEEWTVGEEIRVRVARMEADLLVMGAYGHSRLREYAFGGVTRHISSNMSVPVLLSH